MAEAADDGEIEIWGDGRQTRSFLFIDECLEGTVRLMRNPHTGPVNIGSEEMVTIDRLAQLVMEIAGKNLTLRHVDGPLGVRGRSSDNELIRKTLGWSPRDQLVDGLKVTYDWIARQVERTRFKNSPNEDEYSH